MQYSISIPPTLIISPGSSFLDLKPVGSPLVRIQCLDGKGPPLFHHRNIQVNSKACQVIDNGTGRLVLSVGTLETHEKVEANNPCPKTRKNMRNLTQVRTPEWKTPIFFVKSPIQRDDHSLIPQTRKFLVAEGGSKNMAKGNYLVLNKREEFKSFCGYRKQKNDEYQSHIPALQWILHKAAHPPLIFVIRHS
jgi:hypothetical protein